MCNRKREVISPRLAVMTFKNNSDKDRGNSSPAGSGNRPDKASQWDEEMGVPTYNSDNQNSAQQRISANDPALGDVHDASNETVSLDRNARNARNARDRDSFDRDAEANDNAVKDTKRGGFFNRQGRAEPQTIEPNQGAANNHGVAHNQGAADSSRDSGAGAFAGSAASGSANSASASPAGHAEPTMSFASPRDSHAPTTAFDSQPNQQYQAGAYNDQDFAQRPTSQHTTAQPAQPQTPQFGQDYNGNYDQTNAPGYQDGALAGTAGATAGTTAAAPTAGDTGYSDVDDRKRDGRRGTIDFGLLFVRLALAIYLIVAGASTFFGLGDSAGLNGLEQDFSNYALPQVLAIAVPTLQLLAGAFLLLGLLTPLVAMLGLVVTGFMAIHELATADAGLNIFSWPETVWLSLVLFLIAIALQFTGPGFISLDFSRSWTRRPLATSWVFVVLGIAALVAIWWFGAGVNPLA